MILISLSLAGGVFYLLQQERANSAKLKNNLEDIANKFEVIKREKKDIKRRFKSAKKYLFSYNRIAGKSRDEVKDLKDTVKQQEVIRQIMDKEMNDLKMEMEKLKVAGVDLQRKLADANDLIKKNTEQLKEALAQKSTLEKTVGDLRATQAQKVELGTIVVGSDTGKITPQPEAPVKESKKEKAKKTAKSEAKPSKQPVSQQVVEPPSAVNVAAPGSGLQGKVLVINKDYNFAVVNLGSKDGIKLGDIFSVYHNDVYIGDVKVEKIHDSMSAAGFSSLEGGAKIGENDRVVLKK
jgi:myosin heavy subunit